MFNCLETVMPLRRNGDAVAPERLPRCAGTATPFYWNGRATRKECGCLTPFPSFGLRPPFMCGVSTTPAEPLEVALL